MLRVSITIPTRPDKPEAEQDLALDIELKGCRCGCGKILDPKKGDHQFINAKHRMAFHNQKRKES